MTEPTEPALAELLARMHWVRGLAGALVRDADRADDLAQDAWVKALRAGPAQAASWRGWFARVMKNRVADEGRLQGQHERFTARQPRAGGGPSEEEILQQMETHEALSEALRNLPDPYRRAVFLHYFEGWSLGRISAEEGCDKRAIEKRLRQARTMLRAHLERRAPAEHWAGGLLLLTETPRSALALAAAAAALALMLIAPAAWLLQPDAAPPGADTEDAAILAAAPPPPENAGFAKALEALPVLVRTEVAPSAVESQGAPFDLVFFVHDAETKVGIPNVRVTADCLDEAKRVLESSQGVTDEHGRLVLPFSAPATQAQVSIRPSGWAYAPRLGGGFLWGTYQERVEFAAPLEPLQGSVYGVVRDDSGNPVPGAFVDVWIGSDEQNSPRPDHFVQADREGNFTLTPARSKRDTVFLAPRAAGMYATRCFEVERRLTADARVEGVELTLSPGRSFSVEVIDERRQPIEGARVSIWPGFGTDDFAARPDGIYRGRHSFSRTTDASGKINPVMIGMDPWQVAVNHPAFEKWSHGKQASEEECMLIVLEGSRALTGMLRDEAGLPVPNADVIAEGPAGTASVRSDPQGAFALAAPGLAGQEVRILVIPQATPYAFHVEGPFVPEDLDGPLTITLSRGEHLNVELVYADGQPYDRMDDVEWQVLDGPTARAPGGDAGTVQSWLKLRLVDESDWFKDAGFMENYFHFSQCPLGTFRMQFSNAEGVLAEAAVTSGVKGQKVVLPGVAIAHVVFHGRVVRSGTLEAITRFDLRSRRYAGPEERAQVLSRRLGETIEDPDGKFRFEKLVPGWWEFEIQATPDLTHWSSGRIWFETEDQARTVVLDDMMAGQLTVLHADGSAAAHCDIAFADEQDVLMYFARTADSGVRWQDRTDGNGQLWVARLPRTLPFKVWVTPRNGSKQVFPAGALDPGLTAWTITLPD